MVPQVAATEAFKEAHVYPDMVRQEKDEKAFHTWLETLSLHTYDGQNTRRQWGKHLLCVAVC